MSCEQYDWKGYALGELAANDRREAEAHASGCEGCRGELAQVRLTIDTLAALREEEVPRRIAFVSDKVFEPRWWEMFLKPSFGAALVIAAAILAHGYIMRPAPVSEAVMQARIERAVTKAVADVEQRNDVAYDMVTKQITNMLVADRGIVRQ